MMGVCTIAVLLATFTVFAGASISADTLTVSGISAGGAMAVQFQFAWSSTVRTAGVIAGVPYMCARGLLPIALDCMSTPSIINNPELVALAQTASDIGTIDDISNMHRHAVMLFSGRNDTVVDQGTMIHLAEMYQTLGVSKLSTFFNYSAEHAWITRASGNACGHLGEPFVNRCGLDFAGEFLEMSWRHMRLGWNATRGVFNPSRLFLFDQTKYGLNVFNSMDTQGYVYVPSKCSLRVGNSAKGAQHSLGRRPECHVHVNFHGCTQQRSAIGDTYVRMAGLNEWAESNNVIVIYPQTVVVEVNPKACFDWWGYAGETYAVQEGPQQAGVHAIVRNVIDNGAI